VAPLKVPYVLVKLDPLIKFAKAVARAASCELTGVKAVKVALVVNVSPATV
jgi:hypothetical protein